MAHKTEQTLHNVYIMYIERDAVINRQFTHYVHVNPYHISFIFKLVPGIEMLDEVDATLVGISPRHGRADRADNLRAITMMS